MRWRTIGAALGCALALTPGAAAHEPGVVMTGFGTATVDGAIGADEWSAARPLDFQAKLGFTPLVPTRLLVMNDLTNLYVGVRVEKLPSPYQQISDTFSFSITFDNDHDNANSPGDDVLVVNNLAFEGSTFYDEFTYSIDDGPPIWSALDTQDPSPLPPPGSSEGSGVGAADSIGLYVEMAHPLDTLDDAHDFSAEPGDRLGFRIGLNLWTADGSSFTSLPLFEDLGDIYVSHGRPATTIASGPTGFVRSTAATVTFHGDELAASFSCSLDGAQLGPCVSPLELSGLAQGAHTVRVRAEDEVGYEDDTPATASWTVDTIAPNTRIRSGPSGTVFTRSATFRFRSSEPGSTFSCKLDARRWRRCTSPKTYRDLARGDHVFRVRARDVAGNVDPTPASRVWSIG
jgi:hypothetical protein